MYREKAICKNGRDSPRSVESSIKHAEEEYL
jgi:hypothetical protein